MARSKETKVEFLSRFDDVAAALEQIDSNRFEGYDSNLLLPKLIQFHQAAMPFVEAMRPQPRQRVKRSELSDLQRGVLERMSETGRVSIYEGYRKFIRTADSLVRRKLAKRDFHVYGMSSTAHYELTDEGRVMLSKLTQR